MALLPHELTGARVVSQPPAAKMSVPAMSAPYYFGVVLDVSIDRGWYRRITDFLGTFGCLRRQTDIIALLCQSDTPQ